MRVKWLTAVALAATIWVGEVVADEPGSLQGVWKGPWYIGMSSGVATMEIVADGSGTIAFTNLETFGEKPAALAKTSFDGRTFRFSASGAGSAEFSATMQLVGKGRQLRGSGKYGGFGARLELRRAD